MRYSIVLALILWVYGCTTTLQKPPLGPDTRASTPGEPAARESLVNFVIHGVITHIEDGDTLTLQARGQGKFKIRLSDIDTPETFYSRNPRKRRIGSAGNLECTAGPQQAPGQPFGKAAALSLTELAPIGADIGAECYEVDPFGHLVCHTFVEKVNLNLVQLQRGWAMTPNNPNWIRDPASKPAEDTARTAKLGVWLSGNPMSPDEWRKTCWCGGKCDGAER